MTGFSKIKIIGSAKSRSMDFSDLSLTFPEPTKPNTSTSLKPLQTNQFIKNSNINDKNINTTQDLFSMLEEDDQESTQERFSAKLRRNSSVSSASALQSAMKKAFSMKRSSSVSERYCRIHDQSVTLSSPIHDEDGTLDTMETTRSVKKKHSRSKILKACKKLFGL